MTMAQVSSEAAARTSSDQLYIDDLHVGQRFTSGAHKLDEAQIKAFATQFDPQPFHTDEHAAERTFFKGLAYNVDANSVGACVDRIKECLSLEVKRKTSARTEYFAF